MRRDRNDLTGATALLYARRSKHDPRNPGKSTTDQLDTGRERAGKYGLEVVAEFTDDGIGASRHSAGKVRPGFVNAVDYLRQNPVDVFALWELSRATRRLRVYSDLMEMCEDRGTFLLVGDRIYDPLDATDQMVLGMTAVQDSAEVARLRDRTLRGVASSAAQGRAHGRNIYGYERIYDPRTRQLLDIRPHPEQAPVLTEILQRTLDGDSSTGIAADLNRRGIRKPTGAPFHPSDVREMLSRPTYRGIRDHRGVQVPGTWPALITPEQWTRLQRIFAARSRGLHDTTAKYLLTGIAWCVKCQRPMYVDTKRSQYVQSYYQCRCGRSRNRVHLDAYVREFIDGMLSVKTSHRLLRGASDTQRRQAQERLGVLQAELDEVYRTPDLSPRAVLTFEQRLLPQIDAAEKALQAFSAAPDIAGLTCLPADEARARGYLRSLIRVWIFPSRRGRGFDPSSVEIRRLADGPPSDDR